MLFPLLKNEVDVEICLKFYFFLDVYRVLISFQLFSWTNWIYLFLKRNDISSFIK